MHDDRVVVEGRITRELGERLLPLVHPAVRPLTIEAGPSLDQLEPFRAGDRWGTPWGTTWFRFSGDIPAAWDGRRVEAVIDLGFHPDAAGFQCEGLVVDPSGRPVQGVHPRRTNVPVASTPGPFELVVEAASNPSFPQFRASALGSEAAARAEGPLLYRFRRADLVTVDGTAEALAHDLDVLDGVMRSLPLDDPRRVRLRRQLALALDLVPDTRAARRAVDAALRTPARAGAHRIVATGHAHIDTAWLWPLRETRRKVTRTFSSAVDLMDRYPEYRFSCSQAQQYAWVEEQHPELFERIRAKVGAGQWIPVGGMWVEADMNLPSGESLARQIVVGQRWFEQRFGRRCTEVWIPDVFGYPAGLPQVFAAGGMQRFVTQKLSWNTENRFPHHTFWWEGLDGTRVLTHFPPVDTYNAEITAAECARSQRNFREHAWSEWSLMPFGYGDGGGGPTREMLERARRMEDLDGAPRITVGSPAEFFEHVEREVLHGAPVPVWRGELYLETHRGTLTSQLRTKLGNRRCEHLLREVELWSVSAGVPADTDGWWQELLTQQFHDILPGSSIAWVHADAERTLDRIAAEVDARVGELLGGLAVAEPTLVNSASHARDEIVEVDAELAPVVGGPAQTLPNGRVAFRAAVPGTGLARAEPLAVDDAVVVTERSMVNRHVAVRWDDGGNLTSVIDLRQAREIVPLGELAAVLELAADHPVEYDAWNLESWTAQRATRLTRADHVVVEAAGPLVGRVRVERCFGSSTAAITYTIRAGSPRLDVHVALDWHEDEHLLSVVFPVDVRADVAVCDVQFGETRRPTHPSTPWDAAKFEVCAHRYVDVSEPGFGVAVLNDGRYGHGVFDGRIRVSLARAATYPDPDADRGRHEVTLALFAHGPGTAEVAREAERLNRPLRAVVGSAGAVGAPAVELIGEGVELDAVKPADDGTGDVIVRLHEHVGDRRAVTLRCDRRVVAASRCNLLEEPIAGIEVGDGIVALTLRPFEIATVRVSRAT